MTWSPKDVVVLQGSAFEAMNGRQAVCYLRILCLVECQWEVQHPDLSCAASDLEHAQGGVGPGTAGVGDVHGTNGFQATQAGSALALV